MCDYFKHNLSTQTQERLLYRIHDTFICCVIKLCTKLHNTEPDICVPTWPGVNSLLCNTSTAKRTVAMFGIRKNNDTFRFTQVGVA